MKALIPQIMYSEFVYLPTMKVRYIMTLLDTIVISLEFFFYEMLLPTLKFIVTIIGLLLFMVLCPFGFFIWLQKWSEENFG